jgi:penicillin amidase
MIGGSALQIVGDGGYDRPPRARQLRDDLANLVRRRPKAVTPADLLAIQLDDRAIFLERWHELLVQVLSDPGVKASQSRQRMLAAALEWDGRADADSTGYRLARMFRQAVARRALDPVFRTCLDADPKFGWTRFNYEDGLWILLQRRPRSFLSAHYASWDRLLAAAADDVAADLRKTGVAPADARWGDVTILKMQHPLARALPGLDHLLNMRPEPLPGDVDMPRVQAASFGATFRIVISPGSEAGILWEMPGGQSGNPLSPFYRAGHQAWAQGTPQPLISGRRLHRLAFEPPAQAEADLGVPFPAPHIPGAKCDDTGATRRRDEFTAFAAFLRH